MTRLNKAEIEALNRALKDKPMMQKFMDRKSKKKIMEVFTKNGKMFKRFEDGSIKQISPNKTSPSKKKDGVISFEELKNKQKNKPKMMEAAKGGMVKKYMGGG